ncbi:MAG: hypothetical protein ABIP67_06280 [Burkholderiales bacterium]
MNQPGEINFASKLRSGQHYGVFIDDTGSPGLDRPGLSADRKSWVAVIVPPHQIAEVMEELPNALSYLGTLGLSNPEFHFAEIWNGTGEYSKLNLSQRLGIFGFMADIFGQYRFPVLVQTFDPRNAATVLGGATWPDALGPLKFSDHEDLALIFALLRTRIYLKTQCGPHASACVIVDEGRIRSGTSFSVSGWAPTFVAGSVLYANSRVVHPIQLADFAAFVMNRWQLLRVKERLTDVDKSLLEIISPIAENFLNLESGRVRDWPQISSLSECMNR